jgi:hypothetical protein
MSDWSEVTLERTPAFKRARQTCDSDDLVLPEQPTEEQTAEEQWTSVVYKRC